MAELKPDTPNAAFSAQEKHYELAFDFFRGVGAVREKKERYLPKTPGMVAKQLEEEAKKSAGLISQTRYEAFVMRASFPGLFRIAVSSLVGMTTDKPPKNLDLPQEWAEVERCATRAGETLRQLHAICVREQAKMGRICLVTDIRDGERGQLPVIEPFWSDQVINWRTSVIEGKRRLTLVALRTSQTRAGEEFWEQTEVPVVLLYELTRGGVVLRKFEKPEGDEWMEVEVQQPRSRVRQQDGLEALPGLDGRPSGFRLAEIPLTSITPDGLLIDPPDPPFLDLLYKLWDIYVGSANYREALALFEPTPVRTGMKAEWIKEGLTPKHMGVGVAWDLPEGADAKMLEYTGPTISNMRQALIDDVETAEKLAAQPFERGTAQVESGDSRREKLRGRANIIREIHLSAAAGIQEALRKGARWLGVNPDSVTYEVEDDIHAEVMTPDELRELTQSFMAGAITERDMHANLKRGGVTDLNFDEWRAERDGGLAQ